MKPTATTYRAAFFALAMMVPILLAAQGTNPELRVINLSPDSPPLNAYVITKEIPPVAEGLAFGSATGITRIDQPGILPFILTRNDNTSQNLLDASVQLVAGNRTNVFILDAFGAIDAKVSLFPFGTTGVPASSYLSVMNASPDVGSVDVKIKASNGSSFSVNTLAFRNGTDFVQIPKGSTTLEFYRAGTQTLLREVQGPLAGATHYTAILTGTASNLVVRLLDQTSRLQQAPMLIMLPPAGPVASRLRAVNGLRIPVDVYVDGARIAEGLAFRNTSASAPLAAGSHRIEIAAAGAPIDQAFSQTTITLAEGSELTIFAFGTPPFKTTLLASPQTAGRVAPAGKTLVQVVNGSLGLEKIDVRIHASDGSTTPVSEVAYATAGSYIELPAGAFTIDVAPPGGPTQVRASGELPSGSAVTIVATGALASDFGLNMLVDSDTSAQTPMIPLSLDAMGQLRVVDLLSDAGEVDLFADDGEPAPVPMAFRDASEKLASTFPGAYGIALADRGNERNKAWYEQQVEVKKDTLTTLFVVGEKASPTTLKLHTPIARLTPPAGRSLLRVLHASTGGTSPIDVELRFGDGTKHRFESLLFTDATEYIEVPSGAATAFLFLHGSDVPELAVSGELPADAVMTVIASGSSLDGTLGYNLLFDNRAIRQAPMLPLSFTASLPAIPSASHGVMSIVPNPAGDAFRVDYPAVRPGAMRIDFYDVVGHRAASFDLISSGSVRGSLMVPAGILSEGLYNVIVSDASADVISTARVAVVR